LVTFFTRVFILAHGAAFWALDQRGTLGFLFVQLEAFFALLTGFGVQALSTAIDTVDLDAHLLSIRACQHEAFVADSTDVIPRAESTVVRATADACSCGTEFLVLITFVAHVVF